MGANVIRFSRTGKTFTPAFKWKMIRKIAIGLEAGTISRLGDMEVYEAFFDEGWK